MSQGRFRHHVLVEFNEHAQLPNVDHPEEQMRRLRIGPWDQLVHKFPGISLHKLDPWQRQRFEKAAKNATPRRKLGLLSSFIVDCPPDINAAALAHDLSKWRSVSNAFVALWNPSPPPTSPQPFPPITTILRAGSSGDDVVNLQTVLNMLGAGIAVNGYYGDEVTEAVKRFYRLTHYVYVGPAPNDPDPRPYDCSACGTRVGDVCPHRFDSLQSYLPNADDTSFLTDLLIQMYAPFAGGF